MSQPETSTTVLKPNSEPFPSDKFTTGVNALSALQILGGAAIGATTDHNQLAATLAAGGAGAMVGYHGADLFGVDRDSKVLAALLTSLAASGAGYWATKEATLNKSAELATVTDKPWKYVERPEFMEGFHANLRQSAKEAVVPGLFGAGILALASAMSDKNSHVPTNYMKLSAAALGGFAAGAAPHVINTLFKGPSYNREYTTKHIKPGDDVVVALSGSGTGDGNFDRKMFEAFGSGKYALFRWFEGEKLRDYVNSLPPDAKAHVIGYSWGGKGLRSVTDEITHKNTKFHFIDPVGWRTNLKDGNVPGYKYSPEHRETSYRMTEGNFDNVLRTLGGGHSYEDAITYPGNHCDIGPVLLAISQHIKHKKPVDVPATAPTANDAVKEFSIA